METIVGIVVAVLAAAAFAAVVCDVRRATRERADSRRKEMLDRIAEFDRRMYGDGLQRDERDRASRCWQDNRGPMSDAR